MQEVGVLVKQRGDLVVTRLTGPLWRARVRPRLQRTPQRVRRHVTGQPQPAKQPGRVGEIPHRLAGASANIRVSPTASTRHAAASVAGGRSSGSSPATARPARASSAIAMTCPGGPAPASRWPAAGWRRRRPDAGQAQREQHRVAEERGGPGDDPWREHGGEERLRRGRESGRGPRPVAGGEQRAGHQQRRPGCRLHGCGQAKHDPGQHRGPGAVTPRRSTGAAVGSRPSRVAQAQAEEAEHGQVVAADREREHNQRRGGQECRPVAGQARSVRGTLSRKAR